MGEGRGTEAGRRRYPDGKDGVPVRGRRGTQGEARGTEAGKWGNLGRLSREPGKTGETLTPGSRCA